MQMDRQEASFFFFLVSLDYAALFKMYESGKAAVWDDRD